MDLEVLVPMPIDITVKDMQRFWKYVDRRDRSEDECWPWTGHTVIA